MASTRTLPRDADAWRALTPLEADRATWDLICGWPRGQDTVLEGIDWSLPLRFHLQARAGRAVRRVRDPARHQFERALPGSPGASPVGPPRRRRRVRGLARRRLELRAAVGLVLGPPDLLVVGTHPRWVRTLEVLQQAGRRASPPSREVAEKLAALRCSGAAEFGHGAARLVVAAFEAHGVPLAADDLRGLERDLAGVRAAILRAHTVLRMVRPRLLVVYYDNAPPNMEYVLAARCRGIPCLMIQHGLDCEPLALDEAYATHMALWGEARAERYRKDSHYHPLEMEVTGNPEHDALRPPTRLAATGDYWLWVTRPHSPAKCYLPGRWPDEGMHILDALVEALRAHPQAQLRIKPHPSDLGQLYVRRIEGLGLGARVRLVRGSIEPIVAGAGLVISEDSTAGMDAMFVGKPLIHAHFAQVPPSMPFVGYGAALPAFDPDQLRESIDRLHAPDSGAQQRMLEGQTAFLHAFAGPRDGRASTRLARYVARVLRERP